MNTHYRANVFWMILTPVKVTVPPEEIAELDLKTLFLREQRLQPGN